MKVSTSTMYLKSSNFKKRYKDEVIELKDFEVSGKYILIKGENGSGKSTLLKAISKQITHSGTITFSDSFSCMNERILFTKGIRLKEYLNAFLLLEECDVKKLEELLNMFDLSNKLDNFVETLSKGMKMKLQLLLCLIVDRKVYILDEPFSGIDTDGIKDLLRYMKRSGKEYLITSHLNLNEYIEMFAVVHL